MSLEPRIEAIRKEYGLAATDFWQIPQNKQWVCKHSALEVVAFKASIKFDMPVFIETNAPGLVTSLVVMGHMGDRSDWATGETNPSNYHVKGKQPSYPWAMSEKRAKDRVILKLVGIHGLVYSDAEISAPADEQQQTETRRSEVEEIKPVSAAEQKRGLAAIDADLLDCKSILDVDKCAKIWAALMSRDKWSRDYMELAKPKFGARREAIKAAAEADDIFPADRPSKSQERNSYLDAVGGM